MLVAPIATDIAPEARTRSPYDQLLLHAFERTDRAVHAGSRYRPGQIAWAFKWSEAFREAIRERTGQADFDYRIAVTRLKGDAETWGVDPTIAVNLAGCSVGFLTLQEMWATMLERLTTTPAPSEIGRLAQLLKAAGLTP
ncbi:MAG: hypothetical protein ACRDJ3_07335 [Solirubrobacteraceae bacterium]